MRSLVLLLSLSLTGYAMSQTTGPATTSVASPSPVPATQSTAQSPAASAATEDAKKREPTLIEKITPFLMPIAVLLTGGIISYRMQTEGLKQKYVEMAINILANNQSPPNAPIRDWAFKVLDKFAPVKFSASNVDLPEEVTKGLAQIPASSGEVFYRLTQYSAAASSKGYFYSTFTPANEAASHPISITAKKKRMFRCDANSIRTFDGVEKSYAAGWLDGILEVHIFDKGNTTQTKIISFPMKSGNGIAVFMLDEGQSAKVFNPSIFEIGRGNVEFQTLRLADEQPQDVITSEQ